MSEGMTVCMLVCIRLFAFLCVCVCVCLKHCPYERCGYLCHEAKLQVAAHAIKCVHLLGCGSGVDNN